MRSGDCVSAKRMAPVTAGVRSFDILQGDHSEAVVAAV